MESIKSINNKNYYVKDNEFLQIPHTDFNNLVILKDTGLFERIIALINDIGKNLLINNIICINTTHGGFIPIQCSPFFSNIYLINNHADQIQNINKNINAHNTSNIELVSSQKPQFLSNYILFTKMTDFKPHVIKSPVFPILILENDSNDSNDSNLNQAFLKATYAHSFKLSNTNIIIYIPTVYYSNFYTFFKYCIDSERNILTYDNLIHLCIMVKNAGDTFENILQQNLPFIDQWTILDTGSNDNTVDIINRVLVGKKRGNLYQEPFINFRDSRNRCLELAGTSCKFNVMLDDTYIIQGDFRDFLTLARCDQFATSYSIIVRSADIEYLSNRITKSANKLKYIYTIHEIIQDKNNVNVGIPNYACFIKDETNDLMAKRSNDRKEYDLKCIFEMIEEYPDDPRHIYYLAQTYKVIGDLKKTAETYFKRAFYHIEGFNQEKHDALFEFTRTSQLFLNMPWDECEKYYNMCAEWQPSRPEGHSFIGLHYYEINHYDTAFYHLKKAFEIGYPYHQQYSLKPTLSFNIIPYFLAKLCYDLKRFKFGLEVSAFFLKNNTIKDENYNFMNDFHKNYIMLSQLPLVLPEPTIHFTGSVPIKQCFCIVADGGFTKWSGKNILTDGIGGSETWVIEMSRYIKQLSNYDVFVFCNCEREDTFENVKYLPLSDYIQFIVKFKIQHCIISRFSEYIPVTIHSNVEHIHVILHDIRLSGCIIPIHSKIKNIFCLTEWHKQLFLQEFSRFSNITHPLHYGIDFNNFLHTSNKNITKIRHSFIYSSFPNRGLIILLKMWPQIIYKYPAATLNIFTDVHNAWANTNYPEELQEIRELLELYKTKYWFCLTNHGWTDKKTLAKYWKSSQIWFYPCKFAETFCLTALEAAITQTFVITNDLAALQNTVGNRGLIIPGDVMTEEWQLNAYNKMCEYLDNPSLQLPLIQQNYEWALTHSWKDRADYLLNNFIYKYDQNNATNKTNNADDNIHMTITEKTVINSQADTCNLLTNIDKIYYINLHSRVDRKTHFLNQCKIHNIPEHKIVRFNAIHGATHNFTKDELKLFENANYLQMHTKLQIMGNQLSHFKIFQDMIQNNYNYIIICQDDVVFKKDFCSYVDKLIHSINNLQQVEIIHIGFNKYAARDIVLPWDLEQNEMIHNASIINEHVCNLQSGFNSVSNSNNSTAYILTLNGAKKYVEHAFTNGFKYATDCELNSYLISKNIFYASSTVLATTVPDFGSDVFENIYNANEINALALVQGTEQHLPNPVTKQTQKQKLNINNCMFNYLDMYNWTNDLPLHTNAKLTFVKMLVNFIDYPSCNILEVGTYVGTSVIGMLQYLPNAIATTIDLWQNYDEKYDGKTIDILKKMEEADIENVFKNNIKIAYMENRVTSLKGDSALMLLKLFKQDKQFHFIYIDGSHKCIDCYTDCLLGWQLLHKDGIMAIDDYLYKVDSANILEKIFEGVNYFLEKITGQYIMLEKGYRVFIKKIV